MGERHCRLNAVCELGCTTRRRLRMSEERARRAAEAERLQEVEQNYERTQVKMSSLL